MLESDLFFFGHKIVYTANVYHCYKQGFFPSNFGGKNYREKKIPSKNWTFINHLFEHQVGKLQKETHPYFPIYFLYRVCCIPTLVKVAQVTRGAVNAQRREGAPRSMRSDLEDW